MLCNWMPSLHCRAFVMAAQSITHRSMLVPASALRYRAGMGISNAQNLTRSLPSSPRPFGVRVRLKPGDPFGRLVGADWQTTHWYFTQEDRDAALTQMARRHEYSRIGDEPALTFEKVENLAQSRAL